MVCVCVVSLMDDSMGQYLHRARYGEWVSAAANTNNVQVNFTARLKLIEKPVRQLRVRLYTYYVVHLALGLLPTNFPL